MLAPIARLHVHTLVPWVGALLSGAREYRYLERSIAAFPAPEQFAEMMQQAGLDVIEVRPMTFGACHLFVGEQGWAVSIELASASSLAAAGDRLDWEHVQLSTLALLDAARAEQAILLLSVPAPLVEVEEALRLRAGDAVLWAPSNGPQVVGLGVCHEITGSGPERFAQVRSCGRSPVSAPARRDSE